MNEAVNGEVMARIARSMLQPSVEERRKISKLLLEGADADSLEHRVRLMTGLVMRVKHAFLWDQAPLTMNSLRRSGRLVELFAAYSFVVDLKQLPAVAPAERGLKFLHWLCKEAPEELVGATEGVRARARHELLLLSTSLSLETWKMEGYDADPRVSSSCAIAALPKANCILLYTEGGDVDVMDRSEVKRISAQLANADFDSIAAHLRSTSL